ncbi:type 1 glutamine amidotransferase [Algihabitans albus]|uniref:type 1 glutamine amidotransferase n=1 Tax=Algihabitans albus TaxID=2164067 RepID=UPI000E5CCE4D|nr:type 1 glutamine amidotransferase [Algihabitans albus]
MKRIAIVECGPVPEPLVAVHGSYPKIFAELLQPLAGTALSFETVSPIAGDAVEALRDFDGLLFTGSRYGVYDDLPWMRPLMAEIRGMAARDRPQVGICFGHQIVAAALGGDVRKAEAGWGAGVQTYDLRDHHAPSEEVPVFHQDQVMTPPEGARRLAGNAFCPNGGFSYEAPILTYQFHPEFSRRYLADLIDYCEGARLTAEEAAAARASLARHRQPTEILKRIVVHLSS